MTHADGVDARRDDEVLAATRDWVDKAVVGLGLCPFAGPVQRDGRIRYVVSAAGTESELLGDLTRELRALHAADPEQHETTLLVHPRVFGEFLDYNDFLAVADATVEALGLRGDIQIASFHPDYQFADAGAGDIENYTNRSPYPTLHLLRETSVSVAVDSLDDPATIYRRNVAVLRRLGHSGWRKLFLPDRP